MEKDAGYKSTLWNRFRTGPVWRSLKRIQVLRSGLYLAREMRRTLRESRISDQDAVEMDFANSNDPWNYETSPYEQERFLIQTQILDDVRGIRKFQSSLEIGCAEGLFTEVLADRCESLLVLDLSPTALARAKRRRSWSNCVQFSKFDLRNDPIPGKFHLIVVTGVLEYFPKPSTLRTIREKLVGALHPSGRLFIETTRANPVIENAWWGRRLIRGKWINWYFSRYPSLAVEAEKMNEYFIMTLFRKLETDS